MFFKITATLSSDNLLVYTNSSIQGGCVGNLGRIGGGMVWYGSLFRIGALIGTGLFLLSTGLYFAPIPNII